MNKLAPRPLSGNSTAAYTKGMDQQPTPPERPRPEWQTPPSDVSDMSNYMPPVKPRNILGLLLKVLAVLVLLAVLAAVIYWFLTRPKATTGTHTSTTSQSQQKTTQQTPAQSSSGGLIDAATKQYSSPNFNLSVTYPADWTVTDIASTNRLIIASPALPLKDPSGRVQSAQIALTIQHRQDKISQFAAGDATSVFESQKITYVNPTPDQRAQTYVSFLRYASTQSVSALDALYVTGDNGYQKGQTIPQSDVTQTDPLVTISFLKCADAKCATTGTPLSIAASDWSDSQLSGPLLNMLKSLVLQ